MNTGQMVLSVGAMAILSTVILSMNNSFISAGQDVLRTEIGVTANSLGFSIIEEAKDRRPHKGGSLRKPKRYIVSL